MPAFELQSHAFVCKHNVFGKKWSQQWQSQRSERFTSLNSLQLRLTEESASGNWGLNGKFRVGAHASSQIEGEPSRESHVEDEDAVLRMAKVSKRMSERRTYLIAAIASSVGVTTLAAGAVVYRFMNQLQTGGEVPYLEVFGTLALAVGAAVGMEYWARWAHRALWHDSLWNMHESHHKPREGPFELNDVFAIINAGPAILLLAYGFFNPGLVPGLCFGAGLGITIFGMAYMFVHDGLVHRRFPVGPIADVPYLQEVAAAHQLHHADKYEGVPYGLFLGPYELAEVGGAEDLRQLLEVRRKQSV